ncbi:MAG: SDR family NAD(P)-dependent oxidoreductase, partial [Myxococcota bacterium]|nr:SDR family NAD(P)-dependent oxidoreductase [Myxococcota bacterium]
VVHGLIPHTFVDHTHADAVITVSHAPDGEERIRALYGDRVLVIPYVMPGFILAQTIQRLTAGVDWSKLEGLILMRHGVFSFADDARQSYERMIDLVTVAEEHLKEAGAWEAPARTEEAHQADTLALAELRGGVCRSAGRPMIARLDSSEAARGFASRDDAEAIGTRGPVTPDHVIRTKRVPMYIKGDIGASLRAYEGAYREYFDRHNDGSLTCLDPAPRWAIWPGHGVVGFGVHTQRANQISDISRHSVRSIQWGEALGGWRPLGEPEIFEVEYWELEQAKLRKGGAPPPLQGKVALVTGAAGGIGAAAVRHLRAAGAAVCGLDIQPEMEELLQGADTLGIQCDVTDTEALNTAIDEAVRRCGGLDILVSNAGRFPLSADIGAITDDGWSSSFDLNVTSQMKALRACTPYLAHGVEPA